MNSSDTQIFPDIEAYSKEIGLSTEVLEEAFKLENHYHKLLVSEKDPTKREALYDEFYSNLLQFYGRTAKEDDSLENRIATKDPQVTLFEKELREKSFGFFLVLSIRPREGSNRLAQVFRLVLT